MTEAEWLASQDPIAMLGLPETPRTARKRRLFVVACCRQLLDVMTVAGRQAVAAAEGFADGQINQDVLRDAWRKVESSRVTNRRFASAAALAATVAEGNDFVVKAATYAVNATDRKAEERAVQADLLRDIVGNPFRPATFDSGWRTSTAVAIAKGMYDNRDFTAMPILADALQDAGCNSDDILKHCRDPNQTHVRGCWVVDLVLGKA